jgi:UDP-apiose/xylose synthase
MKIVILGAGGFIGSHCVEHLIQRAEHEVVGVDISSEKLQGITGSNFKFLRADISTETDLVSDLVGSAELVVDLVAHANPSVYADTPLDVFELNFLRNHDVVNLCVRHGTRLMQFSSSEVYGKPGGDTFDEDTSDLTLGPVRKPRWIYAASKQLLERVIHAHGMLGDLDYVIARPFNFVGSRLDYLVPAGSNGGPRVFPHFMSALLTGGPMYLVDGGNQRRSFTHIRDAMSAFQFLIDHALSSNEIFNIGNPANDISIRELALLMMQLFEELTGKPATCDLVEIDGEDFYSEGYEDSTRVPPVIAKMQSLGWQPVYDLRTTFADAMRSYIPVRLETK